MQRTVWLNYLITLSNNGIGQRGQVKVATTVLLPNVVFFRVRAFIFFFLFEVFNFFKIIVKLIYLEEIVLKVFLNADDRCSS